MSTPYIVVFVSYDGEDGQDVIVDGTSYEPTAVREGQRVEVTGPFATKAAAKAYAQRYADMEDCAITVQQLSDPSDS